MKREDERAERWLPCGRFLWHGAFEIAASLFTGATLNVGGTQPGEKVLLFFPFLTRLSPAHRFFFSKREDKANRSMETCCTQQREEGSTFQRCVTSPALLPCLCCWCLGSTGWAWSSSGSDGGGIHLLTSKFGKAPGDSLLRFPISRHGSGELCPAANDLGERRQE